MYMYVYYMYMYVDTYIIYIYSQKAILPLFRNMYTQKCMFIYVCVGHYSMLDLLLDYVTIYIALGNFMHAHAYVGCHGNSMLPPVIVFT